MSKNIVPVAPDHVRASVYLSVKRALRALLGKGDHEPMAGKIADQVAADFDRAKWQVQMPMPSLPNTPGGSRQE
jgi:hypothetical protein